MCIIQGCWSSEEINWQKQLCKALVDVQNTLLFSWRSHWHMNGGVELHGLRNVLVSQHSRNSNTCFILLIMFLYFIHNKLSNLDQLA